MNTNWLRWFLCRNDDVRRSIEALDQILDEFDEGDQFKPNQSDGEKKQNGGPVAPPTPDQAADVIASFFPGNIGDKILAPVSSK